MQFTREINETSLKLTIIFMAALLYLWGWIIVNVSELRNIAIIYELITFLAVLIGGLAYASRSSYPFGVYGMPTLREIPKTTLVGMAVGLAWVIVGGFISYLPRFQTSLYKSLPPFLAVVFAIIISATEETLFRGTVLPTISRLTGGFLGVSITSFLFALLHWVAFNAMFPLLLSAFLFSIVISLLTIYYRTAWVALVAHVTYNFVVVCFVLGLL